MQARKHNGYRWQSDLLSKLTHSLISHLFQKCLALLNNFLATRTFLVGERVTLADIGLACNMMMLYAQVMDPKFREPFGELKINIKLIKSPYESV